MESCITCPEDCGCRKGQICTPERGCIRSGVCGDFYCEQNETCDKDGCCKGKKTIFQIDEDNYGGCGIKCGELEYCQNGVCKKVQEIIQKKFNNKNLTKEKNIENKTKIIKLPCKGCEFDSKCFPIASDFPKEKNKYCNGTEWVVKKNINENCNYDYECKINSCINNICKENKKVLNTPIQENKNSFLKMFRWFNRIF